MSLEIIRTDVHTMSPQEDGDRVIRINVELPSLLPKDQYDVTVSGKVRGNTTVISLIHTLLDKYSNHQNEGAYFMFDIKRTGKFAYLNKTMDQLGIVDGDTLVPTTKDKLPVFG